MKQHPLMSQSKQKRAPIYGYKLPPGTGALLWPTLVGEGKLGSEAADELTPPPPMAAAAAREDPFSNGNYFYTI